MCFVQVLNKPPCQAASDEAHSVAEEPLDGSIGGFGSAVPGERGAHQSSDEPGGVGFLRGGRTGVAVDHHRRIAGMPTARRGFGARRWVFKAQGRAPPSASRVQRLWVPNAKTADFKIDASSASRGAEVQYPKTFHRRARWLRVQVPESWDYKRDVRRL